MAKNKQWKTEVSFVNEIHEAKSQKEKAISDVQWNFIIIDARF